MDDKMKKIGLLALMAFCIGDTIGAGIFSSLPFAVNMAGSGIAYAWIAAVVLTIFVNIPCIIPSSSLPCPSSTYAIPSRLLSPYVGFFELVSMINYIMILGLLAVFFAVYVNILFPGVPTTPVALGFIGVFWVINLFGVDSGTAAQNIIVVVLLISLLNYIIFGLPNMNAENVTLSQFIKPEGFTFTSFCTSVALCYTCLGGCFTGCLVLGDRVKNPRKTLIMAGCLTAVLVGTLFLAISVITCGVAGWEETLPALGDIAKTFMPTGLWYVFMIGGALGAMASTGNAVILSVGYRFDTMAEDGIFPAVFDKKCRFGTKPFCLSIAPIVAIIMVLFNPPLDALMAACSVLGIFGGILRLWPLIRLPERYPHTYRHAVFVLSKPVIWIWVIAATILCAVVSISTILATPGSVWVLTFATLAVMYIYFVLRIKFMKTKGVDVYANMSTPFAEWEEQEERYRLEDEKA